MTNYNESDMPGAGGTSNTVGQTVASLPSAGNAGAIILPSDGIAIYADDGTALIPFGEAIRWYDPSNDTGWTWVNQDSAVLDKTKGGISMYAPFHALGGGENSNWRFRNKALPATPYTITAYIKPMFVRDNFAFTGLGWRRSSDGHMFVLRYGTDVGGFVTACNVVNYSDAKHEGAGAGNHGAFDEMWLRLSDDGTTKKASMSRDGIHFVVLDSRAHADQITPDEVVWGVDTRNGFDAYAWLLSYREEVGIV